MPEKHAFLSASASHRWLKCTPSAMLENNLPDTTSEFAKEGTEAHKLAEKKLNSWLKSGKKSSRFKALDGEMQECTDSYRDYVIEVFNEEKAKTSDAQLLIEQKLDFSRWVPDGFGTGDAVIIGDDTLHVIDLKYGKGVKVDAVGNTQARLYAAGAMDTFGMLYDFEKIKVHIYQPRIDNISTCEYTTEELEKWLYGEVVPKAELAIKGEGEQKPGPWCKFCKVRANCEARMKANLDGLKNTGFANTPGLLTHEQIEQALPILDEIISWAKDLQQFALDRALEGTKFRGFKVVEGRSNRKVLDEPGLIEALHKMEYGDDVIMTQPKLETITTLEKRIGKKLFTGIAMPYIGKPKGKPTLVPESDKRPEYDSAETDFADELGGK